MISFDFVKTWKEYETARKADKPQKQLEILSKIGDAAKAGHSAWNFHRYWEEYINVRCSRNWKLRDSLYKAWRDAVSLFDEPILSFIDGNIPTSDRIPFLKENEARLRKVVNSGFYEAYLSVNEAKCVRNDYEFIVWRTGEIDTAMFYCALRERFSNAVVDLFPAQDSLWSEYSNLTSYRTGAGHLNEQYFKSLYAKCQAFENLRKSFKGEDALLAACCDKAKDIIIALTANEISFEVEDGRLQLLTRNLDEVNVCVVHGKKTIVRTDLKNEKRSFYVNDTLTYTLPEMDDGTYTITCMKDKTKQVREYSKYTISLAQRHDSGGFSIYAADYKSGEPLKDCEILLYMDDKVLDSTRIVSFDDFKYLPDKFVKTINSKKLYSYSLQCRKICKDGGIRLSDKVRFVQSYLNEAPIGGRAKIFLDRAIVKAGDEVRFKVLLYDVEKDYAAKVAANRTVNLSFLDPSGKNQWTLELKTNEFGTAAGNFRIPESSRNGRWRVILESDRYHCGESLRVDDVVLPTFQIVFDQDDRTLLPGEKCTVGGTIKAFGGHNLASSNATYSVICEGKTLKEGEVSMDASGRFSFEFNAAGDKEWHGYDIRVKVKDLTGETEEVYTYRSSTRHLDLSLNLRNHSEGDLSLDDDISEYARILTDNEAQVDVQSSFGIIDVKYRLLRDGKVVREGDCRSGETLELDFGGLPQGIYRLETEGTKEGYSANDGYIAKQNIVIFKLSFDDKSLTEGVEHLFLPLAGDVPAFRIGTTKSPMWTCVALYGPGNVLLDSRMVYLDGRNGSEGSFATVSFGNLRDIPAETTAYAFYFRDARAYTWQHSFTRPVQSHRLPLEFTRFHSKAAPAGRYIFEMKTSASSEAMASVYDKAMEAFASNLWNEEDLPYPVAPDISFNHNSGNGGATGGYAYGRRMMMTKTAPVAMNSIAVEEETMVMADAIALGSVKAAEAAEYGPAVRSDFSTVLAFKPFLRSDSGGRMQFEVNTFDKLSTFIVQVFAHDKEMNNGVASTEMVVSVPVEVSVVEPRFLYEGDRYVLKAKFSNSLERVVNGTVKVDLYAGDDYQTAPQIGSESIAMALQAREDKDFEYEIPVPEGTGTLGIKVSYIAEPSSEDEICGSDAMFVKVPVSPAHQEIAESHSAVLLSGADRDALIASLRAMFVNGPGDSAEVREISIYDMLLEAMPKSVDTTAHNAEALSGSIMVARALLDMGLDAPSVDALSARLRECRNTDGGFGWFPSMSSSPVITAVVLERLAGNPVWAEELRGAVEYLDKSMFRNYKSKIWWGGISLSQYLYVRSMYTEVGFDVKDSADGKELREFRKGVRAYLTPGSDRGLQGAVAAKTRRALTLRRLSADDAGNGLAKALGIRIASQKRLAKSEAKDIASLREYAVEHPSGGAYFPNAFMPWRGLLEGELYEHTLLHRLLGDDRICLWMMFQKETQQWGNDPAYVDALMETLSASQETLDTKIVALNALWTKPFSQVEPAGSGMNVERRWLREVKTGDGKTEYRELKDGEILNVGDKVMARYDISNDENRSFVRLTVARPANMMPVEQLSGPVGWRPWVLRSLGCPTPQGYRNVLQDATEYWYDVYPEDSTSLCEYFYVSQKGRFYAPAVVIESLYAPHYRANDKPVEVASD